MWEVKLSWGSRLCGFLPVSYFLFSSLCLPCMNGNVTSQLLAPATMFSLTAAKPSIPTKTELIPLVPYAEMNPFFLTLLLVIVFYHSYRKATTMEIGTKNEYFYGGPNHIVYSKDYRIV